MNSKDKEKVGLEYEGVLKYGYGICPMMILADRRVGSTAVRLYCVLTNFARNKNVAYPRQKIIADILGINVPRVSELTSELEMYGYISKEREGKNGSITYLIKSSIDTEVEKDLFGNFVTEKMTVKKEKIKKDTVPGTKIKEIIARMAYREGLSVSEWLRNLIVVELKRNEALPMINRIPENFIEIDQRGYE